MSKNLEKIVYKQLIAHPQHHSLLFESQFGVRPTSCYTYFTDLISKATETVFIDSSKAFDTIIHSVIFRKLSSFGAYNVEPRWFIDYLFLRKQIVQFNGVLSEPNLVYTVVPQGSILGPLLFLIFANVLSPLRHCKIITYTDETVIFTSSSDIDAR